MKRVSVLIFGGTSEGRLLSHALSELGAAVTVSVVTAYGVEAQGEAPGITVLKGAKTPDMLPALLGRFDLVIDATHPYARHISASLKQAAKKSGVRLLRLRRPESAALPDGALVFETAGEAAAYLAGREGNVLLTTGAKELLSFAAIPPARLFVRVLPTHDSLAACEALSIPHRNIIAMQGPFSAALNEAILRQFEIRFLVSKDGGAAGGFPEKCAAAAAAGVTLAVLRRPEDTGEDYDTILRICREMIA